MDAPPIIDVHSHWVPPEFPPLVMGIDDPLPPSAREMLRSVTHPTEQLSSLELRLEEMDKSGVDVSILSLPPPGAVFGNLRERVQAAQAMNDVFLGAASQHAGRFGVLIALPLPYVEESLMELERVGGHPHARGLNLQTAAAEGWSVDDARFETVYARAAELGLPALAHPAIEALPEVWSDWMLRATLAPVVSSSLGVARMVFSGMLDRVSGLDVIVPHLGGVLPYLAQRFFDFGNGAAEHNLPWYLRERLFVDTCSYHPPAFRCAVDTCGVGRMVMGTDYPMRGSLQRAVDDIKSALAGTSEQDAVLGANAARWLADRGPDGAG